VSKVSIRQQSKRVVAWLVQLENFNSMRNRPDAMIVQLGASKTGRVKERVFPVQWERNNFGPANRNVLLVPLVFSAQLVKEHASSVRQEGFQTELVPNVLPVHQGALLRDLDSQLVHDALPPRLQATKASQPANLVLQVLSAARHQRLAWLAAACNVIQAL